MDHRLSSRLAAIQHQIEKLAITEELFLNLDASKKAQYGVLYLGTDGTVAEREALVYSGNVWGKFSKALVEAEVNYNKEKRMLELFMKAYDAEHLTYKIENQAIGKQGSQV